jgi:hypothetical protein
MDGYSSFGIFDFLEMFFSTLGTYKGKRTIAKIDIGFHIAPPLT